MKPVTRREAIKLASLLGAALAWPSTVLRSGPRPIQERRDLFAHGHGYSVVTARPDRLEVEFIYIPEPLSRSADADGGPLAYRVTHRVRLWKSGQAPQVERTKTEGTLPLNTT